MPCFKLFMLHAVLPYVQGVSEKIGRVLKQQQVGVSYILQRTINSLFPHPIKEQDDSDCQKSGIVYKIVQCFYTMAKHKDH